VLLFDLVVARWSGLEEYQREQIKHKDQASIEGSPLHGPISRMVRAVRLPSNKAAFIETKTKLLDCISSILICLLNLDMDLRLYVLI